MTRFFPRFGRRPVTERIAENTPGKKPGYLFLFLGVIYPAIVVGIELTTRICATEIFNPMPTIWHTILVASVPVANLIVWSALRSGSNWRPKAVGLINGLAIAVSLYYTLLFLPVLPFAFIGIIWGIGLLPLAPLVSCIAASRGQFLLAKWESPETRVPVPGTLWGLLVAVALILLLELPATLTRAGMKMAGSPSVETSLSGIKMLRLVGDENLMLRSCYLRTGRAIDLLTLLVVGGNPVSPVKARKIYYRVTGHPFNSVAPPEEVNGGRGAFRWMDWDSYMGGEKVAGRVKGLNLDSSRIDGSVDSTAALAYLEWTLVFRNDSPLQREARAQILLPHGGVVSRLTLWIDGEEREAAFASRGKVREAYQKVVRRNRDPVLVTTQGPDRVLVQCFPVLPNGERMKVRIGITAPLIMPDMGRAFLRLPNFSVRNFGITPETRHSVWFESKSPLVSDNGSLKKERPSFSVFALRGSLTDSELADPRSSVETTRNPKIHASWGPDPMSNDERIVVQTLEKKEILPHGRVMLVLDGSVSMAPVWPEILRAMHHLPEPMELGIIVASDSPLEILPPTGVTAGVLSERATQALSGLTFEGGCDNVPALSRAWDLAAKSPHSAIVWIHGPQPVLMKSVEELRQKWERRPNNPDLYDIEVRGGPNRVIERLEGISGIHSIPRMGSLEDDLKRWFDKRLPSVKSIQVSRRRIAPGSLGSIGNPVETGDHLARLWAYDEVLNLKTRGSEQDTDRAIKLASNYKLVTPFTGAVVLETKQQYEAAGLNPAKATEVPTIPEPETWVLMGIALLAILWAIRRRRMQWQGGR